MSNSVTEKQTYISVYSMINNNNRFNSVQFETCFHIMPLKTDKIHTIFIGKTHSVEHERDDKTCMWGHRLLDLSRKNFDFLYYFVLCLCTHVEWNNSWNILPEQWKKKKLSANQTKTSLAQILAIIGNNSETSLKLYVRQVQEK